MQVSYVPQGFEGAPAPKVTHPAGFHSMRVAPELGPCSLESASLRAAAGSVGQDGKPGHSRAQLPAADPRVRGVQEAACPQPELHEHVQIAGLSLPA